jgi:HK97 family phage portal protein
MLTAFRSWLRRRAANWFQLSHTPDGFFGPERAGAASTTYEALSLSPFWCGVRLYQTVLGSLPLVTYRRGNDDSRDRARDLRAYSLLHERPNPAMTRCVFMELLARALFLEREFVAVVRKDGAGELVGIYPVPPACVVDVVIDDEWNKFFVIQEADGQRVYPDAEVIHLFLYSSDGVRGERLLDFAGESLGLHRRVLESGTAFYENAVRPSGYLKYPGKLNADAAEVIKKWWKEEYAGKAATGKLPVLAENGEFVRLNDVTAEDARIIEALSASVDDCGRWLNLSPLQLFNLTRGTYSNLGADNQALYTRSIRPLLEKIELELNHKVFGIDADEYAEFQPEAMLRGDPLQQATVANIGIQNGSVTRNEQRAWLNLPAKPGADELLTPLNMAPGNAGKESPDEERDPVPVGSDAAE